MIHSSDYLNKKGYFSKCLNYITETNPDIYSEEIQKSEVIVLPMPLSRDGININGTISQKGEIAIGSFYSMINENAQIITSTMPNQELFDCSRFFDYSKCEAYLLDNAYLTAEGAVGHALCHSPKALKDSSILILGWGRIAKLLHQMISKYTDKIAVMLRNEEALKSLKNNGIAAYLFSEIESVIQSYDIIMNTVPSHVIPSSALNYTKKNAYISELASKPGGYDHEYASEIGRSSYILRGLPGICAPESAGAALGKCIISYIENGVTTI